MVRAYTRLFELGHVHSVEAWHEGRLAGGTYGVAIGGLFAAESKFYRVRDGSKVALAHGNLTVEIQTDLMISQPAPFSEGETVVVPQRETYVTEGPNTILTLDSGVKVGDVVEVREKAKQLALVLEAIKSAERDLPDYINVDHSKMTASLTRIPALSDVPYPVQMEPNLVVEFYSR